MQLKRSHVIAGLSVVHLTATLLTLALVAAEMGSRFDSPASSSVWSTIVDSGSAILLFPLVTAAFGLPGRTFAGAWGWAPLIANSVLWGVIGERGLRWFARRRQAGLSPGV